MKYEIDLTTEQLNFVKIITGIVLFPLLIVGIFLYSLFTAKLFIVFGMDQETATGLGIACGVIMGIALIVAYGFRLAEKRWPWEEYKPF